jgi:hypothetical protein
MASTRRIIAGRRSIAAEPDQFSQWKGAHGFIIDAARTSMRKLIEDWADPGERPRLAAVISASLFADTVTALRNRPDLIETINQALAMAGCQLALTAVGHA